MKNLLGPILILLFFIILSIWQGRKASKNSRHCLIGLWLSIIGPFGMAIGLGGSIIHIIIGFIFSILFIIGLTLVIKNRKYISEWKKRGYLW